MAPATFSDLPPEMVGNVFAFVRRKADQGAICLVSRAWRDSMAPMMWEKLETNLSTASPRSMATLLHPRSGVLSHVRDLVIYGTKDGEDRLKQIIAAIPRNRVRKLWTNFDLDTLTLQLLLLSHCRIEALLACRCFLSPGRPGPSYLVSEEHHEWIGSLLLDVSSIQFRIQPKNLPNKRIFDGIKSISRHCPKIVDVALISDYLPGSGHSDMSLSALFSHATEGPLFPNLTTLRLYDLNISKAGDKTLCSNFNLSQLRNLDIIDCNYLISLLEGLSSFYTDSTGRLNHLTIVLPDRLEQPPKTIQAIERLLKACPKLRSLQIDLSRHGLVAKDCILAHCQTLMSLWISSGAWGLERHLSAEDMSSILGACTKLKGLAINMPDLDMDDTPRSKAGFSFGTSFVNMLIVISKSTTIQAFRIFNLPKYRSDYKFSTDGLLFVRHITVFQLLMQNIANQILRFMAEQGSNLKVLGFKPTRQKVQVDEDDEDEDMIRDENDHRWPENYYCRGRATDITGMTVATAHPLKNIALEFPEFAKVFEYID